MEKIPELDNLIFLPPDNSDTLREDLRMSYSKLDTYENCPFGYHLKYDLHKLPDETKTLALGVGSLCHKILELKTQNCLQNANYSDEDLKDVLLNGWKSPTNTSGEGIEGINDLKTHFDFIEWYKDSEGGNYEKKMKRFFEDVLPSEIPQKENGWETIHSELPFYFYYKFVDEEEPSFQKQILFNGFIDRVDRRLTNSGEYEYRVVDYKTSKKVYDEKKLSAPLQMIIYGMYIYLKYGSLPIQYQYSFILLNERQFACIDKNSKRYGTYWQRGIKKINKLFGELFRNEKDCEWPTKPSPLCYWCDYREDGLTQDPKTKMLCRNFSLWTPDNKTFTVYDGKTEDLFKAPKQLDPRNERRRLVF